LQDVAAAVGVTQDVKVQSTKSVSVVDVRDQTAVRTVSVGVGAVMVLICVPYLTVAGGRVE